VKISPLLLLLSRSPYETISFSIGRGIIKREKLSRPAKHEARQGLAFEVKVFILVESSAKSWTGFQINVVTQNFPTKKQNSSVVAGSAQCRPREEDVSWLLPTTVTFYVHETEPHLGNDDDNNHNKQTQERTCSSP
jgi:hypothetical protein